MHLNCLFVSYSVGAYCGVSILQPFVDLRGSEAWQKVFDVRILSKVYSCLCAPVNALDNDSLYLIFEFWSKTCHLIVATILWMT